MKTRAKMSGICKGIGLLLLVVALVLIPQASAKPEYATAMQTVYGVNACGICHINSSGGGNLTAYGSDFANQSNHSSDPTTALNAIGVPTNITPSTTTPTPNTTTPVPTVPTTVTISNPGNITINDSDIGNSVVIGGLPIGAIVQFMLNKGIPINSQVDSTGTTKLLLQSAGNLDINATPRTIQNLTVVLENITVTPTSPPSGGGVRSSGGSGTGVYPTVTATVNKTTAPTPIGPIGTETTITPTETAQQQTTTTETPQPVATTKRSPGFESIIGIIGLFSIAYLLRRR